MSDNGAPQGMCSAIGCPLFGSISASTLGDGNWLCFCHFGKKSGSYEGITRVLNSDTFRPICGVTLDIREYYGKPEWPQIYRNIQQSLVANQRQDLLLNEHDESPFLPGHRIVKQWLGRIERVLINATIDIGKQTNLMPKTVPTASVVGPTHIAGYMPGNEA